ncbi:VAMP5 protein, partial [Vireo altiloquus]|nr:VAMP5 protein [Vireo altiloquus]
SDTRGPPGSGCPGAGPGPLPGLSVPTGGTRPPGAVGGGPRGTFRVPVSSRVPAPVSLAVPRCPLTPQRSCPSRSPSSGDLVPTSPRFPSPWSPCAPPASTSPVSPRCPHGVSTVSPRCPQAGLARCQREAEEVTELMRQNVARALEREGRLEQLQSRAQDLRQAGEAFTRTTQTVARRQRRRHRRWHLVALGLGLLLLFILGLALALALARPSPGTVTSTVPTPQGAPSTSPAPQGHQ